MTRSEEIRVRAPEEDGKKGGVASIVTVLPSNRVTTSSNKSG